MRYLVTGATGFLGRSLVSLLLIGNHEVTALVRDPIRAASLLGSRVTLSNGDVTDRASVTAAVSGVDGVFHLAAWYEVGRRNPAAEAINVGGTRNVIEEAWRAGVPRIVYTSTLAINSDTRGETRDESFRFEGTHISEYDRTKWLAHYEVAEPLAAAGAPVVTVQPGVIYGPGDQSGVGRLFRTWIRGRPTAFCPTAAYCWGQVEDTARGHLQAMELGVPARCYMICGPPHSLDEAFRIAAEVMDRPPPRWRLQAGMLRGGSRIADVLARVVPTLAGTAELLRTAAATYLGDAARARTELGFLPRDLRTGLAELLPVLAADPAV
jgi:nucleoside-diphosphate-sugar epimerase